MPMVSLTRSGFPRLILSKHRKVIRAGGPRAEGLVKVYLSLFSFYKILVEKTGKASIKEIVGAYEPRVPFLGLLPTLQR